MPPGGIFRY